MTNKYYQLPPVHCDICGLKFQPPMGATRAKYCSKTCKHRANNTKARNEYGEWAPGKIECAICHGFYHKVGAHVFNEHNMIARKYREKYGFDVKRGQCSPDLREVLASNVFENGTVENLKLGEKYRFDRVPVPKYKRSQQTLERLRTKHLKIA